MSNAEQALDELKEWLTKSIRYLMDGHGTPERILVKNDTLILVIGKIAELERDFKE